MDDVKNVMVQNIEMVLERGEKLELLVDKTEQLQSSADTFKFTSNKLKNVMFWKTVSRAPCWAALVPRCACAGCVYATDNPSSSSRPPLAGR